LNIPITKEDVLQVLGDPKLHSIRFSVGPIQVNSVEYDKVSDYIEAGAIDVAPGKASYSKYIPQKDTLVTRIGNPPLNEDARTNLLHECTHAIADINECDVTRLTDEAAAYLAQVARKSDPPSWPTARSSKNVWRCGHNLFSRH
jgi:hypothetical protein